MKKILVGNRVVAYHHETSVVIDDSAFGDLSLKDKTELLTAVTAIEDTTLSFRTSFAGLTDYHTILTKLKQGEDVRFELTYLEIEMTPEQEAAIKGYHAAVKPVVAAIMALIPPYPFATVEGKVPVRKGSRYSRGDYYASAADLQRLWNKASKLWSGIRESIGGEYMSIGNHNKTVYYYTDRIEIGCQTIRRWELEQVAVAEGWVFPTKEAIAAAAAKKVATKKKA